LTTDLPDVNRELAYKFFATFARFEFALKKAGYVRSKPDGTRVAPDWDSFTNDLVATFNSADWTPILESCKYLRNKPPQRQALLGGKLGWKKQKKPSGPAIRGVIESVCIVRNNVFHGCKFHGGEFPEPVRNTTLIDNCLQVLEGLLRMPLPKDVAEIFKAKS
jgi:hypothetical protein